MLSLKHSDDIAYNGVTNVARIDLYADTAADLTGVTSFDSITLLGGSTALDISTGDLYIMQSGGTWILQPSQGAFSNVYTKAEIDAMIANYYTKTQSDDLYEWITVTITTDTLPLEFIADGSPLTAWSMLGNGQQTGTPTPDNPIQPDFVGTLENSDWAIPIICAEQTVTVNLGAVQTVRKIKKIVLDGTESFWGSISNAIYISTAGTENVMMKYATVVSSHYKFHTGGISNAPNNSVFTNAGAGTAIWFKTDYVNDVNSFKAYIANQYANGTPVVLWYILDTEQTGITNEPLAKIGDYADELHMTNEVTIPTVKGSNTLTVDTELQPSEMTITGKIRET